MAKLSDIVTPTRTETSDPAGPESHNQKPPRHIAIIMDGNGRWAASRGLPRLSGHREGMENLRRILHACEEFGVYILTLYAFSTENWSRPQEEVGGLMLLAREVIDRELNNFQKRGVRLCHIGQLAGLSPQLVRSIQHAVEVTQNNDRFTLNVAFNYGGRTEILDAVRRLIVERVPPEDITEELFARYLYTGSQPDPDLIIRTAGEVRLSNFLLWQAAYAEYYSTPVYWPDFSKEELGKALSAYAQRDRRFGKV